MKIQGQWPYEASDWLALSFCLAMVRPFIEGGIYFFLLAKEAALGRQELNAKLYRILCLPLFTIPNFRHIFSKFVALSVRIPPFQMRVTHRKVNSSFDIKSRRRWQVWWLWSLDRLQSKNTKRRNASGWNDHCRHTTLYSGSVHPTTRSTSIPDLIPRE